MREGTLKGAQATGVGQAAAKELSAAASAVLAPGKPHQFLTLDALRGVAALAVIGFHGRALLLPFRFASGYLAVDFFFLLSGFVLAHAYGRRLDSGWPTLDYMKTRVVRLYPLYLLGLLLGLGYLAGLRLIRHQPVWDPALLVSFGLGLLILPVMSLRFSAATTSFPLNYPSWSIFFELLVNLVQGLCLRRRSRGALLGVAAVCLLAIVAYTRVTGTINVGLDSPENLFCVFRVLFAYALGMVLYRVWRSGRFTVRIPPWLVAMVLLLLLALPVGGHLVVQEIVVAAGVFPLLILVAAHSEPGRRWRPLFRLLGQLSYAVYILHGPLLATWEQMWTHWTHLPVERAAPWNGLLFLLLVVPFALLADRWVDLPMRRWLRDRLLPRQSLRRGSAA